MKKLVNIIIVLILAGILSVPVYGQKNINYEDLDTYISKEVENFELTGLAVSVVKDGKTVFSKSYGYKNIEKNEPMAVASMFNIASCSKAFTAACLGILVDEGKIKWKDKVADYIPEFRLEDSYAAREMNLIDLLSHRSGLGTFYGDLLWYQTDYSNMDIIKRMRHLPATKDFRSEFGYQNNMYMIAGEIIKKVSGKTWSEFIYEKIFNPLGMTESKTCSRDLTDGQDIAMPHLKRKLQELYLADPGPAFSIYTSVNEISNWMNMLLNNGKWNKTQVIKSRTVNMLFSSQTILPVGGMMKRNGTHFRTYGLGWFLFDYSGKKIVEHDGGMPGYISKVTLVPEEKLGIVLLTNDMNILTGPLRYKILDTFLNDSQKDWAGEYLQYKKRIEAAEEKQKSDKDASRAKDTRPSLDLAGYTGTYNDKMYGEAKIELINNVLNIVLLPAKEVFTSKMDHWHYDTFRIKFRDEFLPQGFVTFSFNSGGKVTGFKIDLPNPDFHFFNLDFKKNK